MTQDATMTTTGSCDAITQYVQVEPPQLPDHKEYDGKSLFDVYIRGLDELVLVPKSSLGAAMLIRWLGMQGRNGASFVGDFRKTESLQHLSILFAARPELSVGGEGSWTKALTLSPEELALLQSTLTSHRNAKRGKPAPKKRRTRR